MKSLYLIFLLFPLYISVPTSDKQVKFLPLTHSSFKSEEKQDSLIVYTPVDEIISIVNPLPCDVVLSPYYDLCSSYLTCGSCVLSPYCGWCTSASRCLPGSVSSVYCQSACPSTWLFTDYNNICVTSFVSPTIVATTPVVVESVTHAIVTDGVYVQIGVQEKVITDNFLNKVIETVPIYAQYQHEIPVSHFENAFVTLESSKNDQPDDLSNIPLNKTDTNSTSDQPNDLSNIPLNKTDTNSTSVDDNSTNVTNSSNNNSSDINSTLSQSSDNNVTNAPPSPAPLSLAEQGDNNASSAGNAQNVTDTQNLSNNLSNSTAIDNQVIPAADQSGGSNSNATVLDGGNAAPASNETNLNGNNTINTVPVSTETGAKLRKKLF